MQLSANFTLSEFTISETASRRGLPNDPPEMVVANIKRLTVTLEEVRLLLGKPINILSGYRSVEVNRAIGGSLTSAHMQGLAADFTAPPISALEVCRRIEASSISFDQLIYEYTWVHLGLALVQQRRQVLTRRFNGSYVNGIVG